MSLSQLSVSEAASAWRAALSARQAEAVALVAAAAHGAAVETAVMLLAPKTPIAAPQPDER